MFAALALAAAFIAIVVATALARGLAANDPNTPDSTSARALQGIAGRPGLRFGENQTPAPLAFAPFALMPPATATLPGSPSPYPFIWPDDFPLVQGMWAGHPLGIDIGVPFGQPVHATRDGHVIFAGGDPCCNYGLFVILEHDNGFSSLYAHFSRIDVRYGDVVRQGLVLGMSGGTGHVTGPHVHFELHHNGGVVNPLDYLEPHRDWAVTVDLLAELQQRPSDSPSAKSPTDAPTNGPAIAAANEPDPSRVTPATNTAALNTNSAIMLGAQWLARHPEAAYAIDPLSCAAGRTGPNWWVTCDGHLQGCRAGPNCVAQLSACVLTQPLIVAASCP